MVIKKNTIFTPLNSLLDFSSFEKPMLATMIKIIKITIHQDKQTKTRERYSNIVIIKKTDYLLPRLSKLSKHTDKLIDFEHTMPHEMCKWKLIHKETYKCRKGAKEKKKEKTHLKKNNDSQIKDKSSKQKS